MEIDTAAIFDLRAPHRYCRACSVLLKDYGGKKHLMHPFGMLIPDVWTDIHRIRHKKRRDEHPCQLPVPLLERLILMTTDKDDLVLDPFLGTGTTAIAAKRLGRRYIGIDIDPDYVELSKSKLETTIPTLVNGVYVSNYLGKIMSIRDVDYPKLIGQQVEKPKTLTPQLELQLKEQKRKYSSLQVSKKV